MLFSEIVSDGRKGEVSGRNVKVTKASAMTSAKMQPATLAASFGFRLCPTPDATGAETGRATIGRPSSHRSRSSARSPAE